MNLYYSLHYFSRYSFSKLFGLVIRNWTYLINFVLICANMCKIRRGIF